MDSIFRNLMVGEASPLDSAPVCSLSVRAVCFGCETWETKGLDVDDPSHPYTLRSVCHFHNSVASKKDTRVSVRRTHSA